MIEFWCASLWQPKHKLLCPHKSSLFYGMFSAAAPEKQQVSDSEQATASPPGEERHEGFAGRVGQRGLLVLHPALLQAQLTWRQGVWCFLLCVLDDRVFSEEKHTASWFWFVKFVVVCWLLSVPAMCQCNSRTERWFVKKRICWGKCLGHVL